MVVLIRAMTGGKRRYLCGKVRAKGAGAPVCLSFSGTPFQFPPHISQLNLVWELSKMKGLKLEELWLEGNPLCDTFPDQPTYIRSV